MERMRTEEDRLADLAAPGSAEGARPAADTGVDDVVDLAFDLTRAGLLAVEGFGGERGREDAARVTVTFRAPGIAGSRGGFHDVVPLPGDRIALVAGGLVTTRGPSERALVGAVRSALGSSMATCATAGEMLTEAARSVRAHAPLGTAAGAALCALDRSSGALNCAVSGPAWAVLVRADGRLDVLGAPGHPLGGEAHDYATRHEILLDGDLLVLCFGVPPTAALDESRTQADVSELVRSASAGGTGLGRALLSTGVQEELAATVLVLEAAG
jgi:hypothetical protein